MVLLCFGAIPLTPSDQGSPSAPTPDTQVAGETTPADQPVTGGPPPAAGSGTSEPDVENGLDVAGSNLAAGRSANPHFPRTARSRSSARTGSSLAKAPFTSLPGDIFLSQDGATPGIVQVDPTTGIAVPIVTTPPLAAGVAGIAIDASGRVLVTIDNPPEILRIDPTTGAVSSLRLINDVAFFNASDAAVEDDGKILVPVQGVDSAPPAVRRYDPGTMAETEATDGLPEPELVLELIGGIAIEADGNIVFSLPALQEIRRVDRMTKVDTVLSSGVNLTNPAGLAIAPNGSIIVADPGSGGSALLPEQSTSATARPKGPGGFNEVISIDPVGGAQTVISADGLLTDPFDVAVEGDGAILVADGAFSATASIVRLAAGTFTQSPLTTSIDNMRRLEVVPCLPSVTNVTPSNIPAGDAATPITVDGSCFNTTSVISFDGTLLGTTFVSATILQATVPEVEIGAAGSFNVIVTNTFPAAGASGPFAVTVADPSITSLTPPNVCAGDPAFVNLGVNGANFAAAATVNWDASLLGTTFVNSTLLNADPLTLHNTVGTPTITVVNNPGGVLSTGFSFPVVGPSVSMLNPLSTIVGGPSFSLIVTGGCFVTGSTVLFNSTPVVTVVNTGAQVTGTISAGLIANAGTVLVQVVNPGGALSGSLNFDVNNPAPTLTSLSQNSATAGGPGFTLTLMGVDFVNGATVSFDGVAQTTTFVNGTTLEVMVSAAQLAAAGTINVTVFNGAPGGSTSAALTFTINNPAPTLTSLGPNSATVGGPGGGSGVTVTVMGAGFTAGSTVLFDGVPQPTTFFSGATLEVTVTLAQLAATGTINVTVFTPAPGGGTSGALLFPINNPAPALTIALNPNIATAGETGFTLTLTAQCCFVNGSVVLFDGVARATTFVNSMTLQVMLSAEQLVAGIYSVTVFNPPPGGGTSVPVQFFVANPVPTLTFLSPAAIPAGGAGFTLTATGTNLAPNSVVRFGATGLATTFVSSTSLTATVPAALVAIPGTQIVTVESPAPGGGISGGLPFVVEDLSSISGLHPSTVCAGDVSFLLTVIGSDFLAGSQITWDGVARPTNFVDASTLRAQIPGELLAAPGDRAVRVVSPGGGETVGRNFTITGLSIGLLRPSSAAAGGPPFDMDIFGNCLLGTSIVFWNDRSLSANFFSGGGGYLVAQVPMSLIATSGQAAITVRNSPQAISPGADFLIVAPAVNEVSVVTESTSEDGVTVSISGANFVPGSIVRFAGQQVSTTFLSPNSLKAFIPKSLLMSNPNGSITVESPGGALSDSATLPLLNLTSALPNGRVGSTYVAGLDAAGGVPPYAWAITGGTLHQGLQLNPAGSIGGVPGEGGNFFVTLEVADNSGQAASQAVPLSILGLILLSPSKLSIDLTPNAAVVTRTVTASVEDGPVEIEASASTTSGVDWLSVSPQTATADVGVPAGTTVTIDPEELPIGVHIGQVDYSPTNGPTKGLDFPATSLSVIVTVNPTPTLIQLSQTGLRFTGVAGAGNPPEQTFSVGNLGVGDLPWTVASSTVSGSAGGINWLSASPPNGTSTAGDPLPEVVAAVDTTGLAAGQYYGQVQVGAEGTANSPQVVTVVLNLLEQGAVQAGPVVEPLGLFFVAPQGGEPSPLEEIEIVNVSGEPVTFTSVRLPEAGIDPFTHTPTLGTVESGETAAISVGADPGTLAPGEYRASLELAFSNGVVRSAELLLLVTPPPVGPLSQSSLLSQSSPLTQSVGGTKGQGGCAPTRLLGNFTSLGQGFTAPAAWPSTVAVEVADDCGGAISKGAVVASFTVGASVALVPLGDGHWENSWAPASDSAGAVTVTVDMESLAGLKGSRELTGSIAVNDAAPPHVPDGAIVSSASFDPDLPLSPGTLVTIFGSNLSLDEAAAPALPLPLELGGTSIQIAGRVLPLLFVSARQVNALVPYELPANTSQQMIIRRGGTISHPSRIELAVAQPDVFAFASREGIVVDLAGILVTVDNPVAPGDIIVIFAAGLGPVAPEVTSGAAAPVSPLAFAAGEVTVTIGGLPAQVFFAGLAPGFAGLYQVNALVPEGVTLGDAVTLVIQVGDGVSRTVTIAVR